MSKKRVPIGEKIAFFRRAKQAAKRGEDMEEFVAAEEERDGMDIATILMLMELFMPLILRLFDRS